MVLFLIFILFFGLNILLKRFFMFFLIFLLLLLILSFVSFGVRFFFKFMIFLLLLLRSFLMILLSMLRVIFMKLLLWCFCYWWYLGFWFVLFYGCWCCLVLVLRVWWRGVGWFGFRVFMEDMYLRVCWWVICRGWGWCGSDLICVG